MITPIKELKNLLEIAEAELLPEGNVLHGLLVPVELVREIISAQPEPQWIPVSERLPEESEYYIITANDGVGHRTTFAKFQKKAKSWDLTGARSY